MQVSIDREDSQCDLHMEEKLARLGAKIDTLIEKAGHTRDKVKQALEEIEVRQQAKLKQADEAMAELKHTIDLAVEDLTGAWQDIKTGTERASIKLCGQRQVEKVKFDRLNEYDYFFCDSCRNYIYDEARGDQERGLPPRTLVDDLPPDWSCPRCGAAVDRLRLSTMWDDYEGDQHRADGQRQQTAAKAAAS